MEYELKYIIPAYRLSPVLDFIGSQCLTDTNYPATTVSSIYFDNRQQSSLYEKVNSDFFKCKVRLRWYDSPSMSNDPVDAFFEIKTKMGSQRVKQRVGLQFEPGFLRHASLSDIRFVQLANQVSSGDAAFDSCRLPVLMISYHRKRFVDPLSGCRISVDSNISVPRVNHQVIPSARPASIQNAVIEIKGNSPEIPRSLIPLQRFGVRKSSFSKYLSGYARANRILFDPR